MGGVVGPPVGDAGGIEVRARRGQEGLLQLDAVRDDRRRSPDDLDGILDQPAEYKQLIFICKSLHHGAID